ncbi:MAG TPA: HDOD domain-containing protein [Smithellaceae bacterium]|jgi:putative nucleotidyltransferase with HDIG domain|nr:HDOD domain-containing protein [Syntrophaceae bacterium]HPL96050.1 HDOD domain-containing protein [Smithellaceae bacterium]HPV48611.1 HDOD domain-containing protein [Smithellaceae bacterium]
MDPKILRHKVENISTLPTIPGVLKRLSTILEKPRVTIVEISSFISNDPALTTKVLKMVNSAIYGFPGRIASVSHATMLLGLNVIKGLLLGVSVFDLMQKTMSGLYEHSLATAIASRVIAQKKNLKEPEEVSVAGLLHDIGKVVLILEFAAEYEQAMTEAARRNISIYEAEKKQFNATHADVGGWLAEKWRFPANLIEVIACHHQPTTAKSAPLETAIVHLADLLTRARGFGFAGEKLVPEVHPVAFELLGLSEQDILEVLQETENNMATAEDIS